MAEAMVQKSAGPGAWGRFMNTLNTSWHERALWIYMFVVIAHWAEHISQAYQVYVLNWARPESLGFLGLWQPILVKSELLHFGYAVFMLAGLFILRPAFQGRSRLWWDISLGIQAWHFVEHALLQWQAAVGSNFFGSPVPISIVQIWVPRVELHLIYNALVFIPMVVAVIYHMYPPKGERQHPLACTCSRYDKRMKKDMMQDVQRA